MRCQHCGFESPPGFAFCGKCGQPFGATCAKCGATLPPGFAFCGRCGTPVAAATPAPDQLSSADLAHLRPYLPSELMEALSLDPVTPAPRLLEHCLAQLSSLLETTCTQLPTYLVESILRTPQPGQPGGRFLHGTLLFADISGFTAMSERLSRLGHEGAEEVTGIINRYFDVMLAILREYGGQLMKFGGDALLGLFLEPASAWRAAQAALTMQAAMSGFAETRTSQGTFPLRMKVSVRQGRFFSAELGTAQGMEYALFGGGVNATAQMASAAQAGQVLIDADTLATLPATYDLTPVSAQAPFYCLQRLDAVPPELVPSTTNCVSLPTPPQTLDGLRQLVGPLEALAPYLPTGLLPRLLTTTQALNLAGEHRLVAILFANVHGLGTLADALGPGQEGRVVAALNDYFTRMAAAVRRFGGVVNKIDLYDHGDKLLAFFGAPVAHEDDAERAVRAALEMQAALPGLAPLFDPALHGAAPSQNLGLSCGQVFAGYVGASWRHEYTVMGDEVNLAARLMSVAQVSQIVVSPAVQRRVQPLFELASQGEVSLKGKSQPVPIFSVEGARAEPQPLRGLAGIRSPLVGRVAEWDRLLAVLQQFGAGKGQIVSITGEAGLGKSRLVAELRQHLKTQPGQAAAQWIEGRCLSYTEDVSFYPFRQVVRELAGLLPDQEEASAWNTLSQTLAQVLPADEALMQLPYLANFLTLAWESRPEDRTLSVSDWRATPTVILREKVRYLDGEALQRRTFLAIRTLLIASAKLDPLVLVLDDLHWIDQASLALLEYLMPAVNAARILLVLLYRPDREKGCWHIHEKATREFAHCNTVLALQRLGPDDNRQLLSNLMALDQWPPDVVELLVARTEGNPLYLEEVLRTLMDDGLLVRNAAGQWQFAGAAETIKVPTTLQGVLMARLDRLEAPCRNTAQVAAVVGRTFPYQVVREVEAADATDLDSRLVRLQQHEIIQETQRAPELIYAFRHGMMQEVYYDSLLARARRQYHCKIAAYLEASGGEETESAWPLVAHHAYLGQDWPRAVRWLVLAGRQARQLFANKEAGEYFRKAQTSVEHLPDEELPASRLTIHLALGELDTTAGQYAEARLQLLQARALAQARHNGEAEARACRWLARGHELCGEYAPALEWIEKGLAVLAGRRTAEASQLRLIAGLIYSRQGRLEQASAENQLGLEIAKELGELTVLARAHLLLAVLSLQRGDSQASTQEARRALELYTRAGDLAGQATTHNQLANACFNMGQWSAADDAYRQAREVFEKLGDVYNGVFVDNNRGEIALNQGRLAEAVQLYQAALAGLEQAGGSPYVLGVLHNNLGAAFIRHGRLEPAREQLRLSRECFDQAQARDVLPELQRHWAEMALATGDLPEAEAQSQQALTLARELETENEAGIALRLLGEIALAQGRLVKAEAYLSESLLILEKLGETYQAARTRLAQAQVALARQQPERAAAELAQCEPVFARLEAAPDLAAARALQARL